jgi:hypothetical protein
MTHTRVTWQNSPSTATPHSAANLNIMDAAIKTIDDVTGLSSPSVVYPSKTAFRPEG